MKNAATSLPKYSWTEAPCQTAVQRKVHRQSLKNPKMVFVMKHLDNLYHNRGVKEQILSTPRQKNQLLKFVFVFWLQDEPKSVFVISWATESFPTRWWCHSSRSASPLPPPQGIMSFTIQSKSNKDRSLCHHLSKKSGEFQWRMLYSSAHFYLSFLGRWDQCSSPYVRLAHCYKTASFVLRQCCSLFLQDPKSLVQRHPCLFSNTINIKLQRNPFGNLLLFRLVPLHQKWWHRSTS